MFKIYQSIQQNMLKEFIIGLCLFSLCFSQDSGNLTGLTLQNAKTELKNPIYSISNLFSKYPTSDQLNELILNGDSFPILKLIQNLLNDDSITCNDTITYLTQIGGRIKGALEQKTYGTERLSIIIEFAEDQIARLSGEISRLKGEEKFMKISEKRQELNELVQTFTQKYGVLNELRESVRGKQKLVQQTNSQIIFIQLNSTEARQQILNEELILTEITSEIAILQEKLRQAHLRKQSSESLITMKKREVRENDRNISSLRGRISSLSREIDFQNRKIDWVNREVNEIEVRAERLRSDISEAEIRIEQIDMEIGELKKKIQLEEQKLQYEDLRDVAFMKDALTNLLPGIDEEINKQYYNCYTEGLFEIERVGSLTFFTINGQNLKSYISSAYGIDIEPSLSFRQSQVKFHELDIFSQKWVDRYGSAVQNETLEGVSDFSRLTSFWCLNPDLIKGGYGKVMSIKANKVVLRTKSGGDIEIELGSCSRMESTIARMPEVGQSLFWKGTQVGSSSYNLYQGTFLN